MLDPNQIESPAKIVEVLDHGAYRAELANGHACIVRPLKGRSETYAPGDTVRLAFHPADLSARGSCLVDDERPLQIFEIGGP